jgi:hypothetical protein
VVGGLADLQLLGHLRHVLALGQQPVGLPELADDLLGSVAASLHRVLLGIGTRQSHMTRSSNRGQIRRTKLKGSGQNDSDGSWRFGLNSDGPPRLTATAGPPPAVGDVVVADGLACDAALPGPGTTPVPEPG